MKKIAAALLALIFMLSTLPAYAASASFTLNLSAKEVQRGGEIILSGTTESDDTDVVVKIVRPNQTILYIDSVAPSMGSYSAKVKIPDDENFAPYGEYKVAAGSKGRTESRTFVIVDPNGSGGGTDPDNGGGTNPGDGGGTDPGNGGGTNPGDGGGTDPGNGGGTYPGEGGSTDPGNGGGETPGSGGKPNRPHQSSSGTETAADGGGIPSGAGKASDGVVQPDSSEDGRYVFGSDTLAQAIAQAKDAVTIQLPAEAGVSGQALEFPAKSLQDLQDKNLDLIIQDGDHTVRFPAGSIAAFSDEVQSRIRIELNFAWTEEAKDLLSRSLKNQPDYTGTGVILSVVIKAISGDSMTEIHELDKPAAVMIRLTPEQERAISTERAGVYYVDGKQAEYVGGTIRQGVLTFAAAHFSYYTLLEYNKAFADVSGHWAEPAVLSLAAKRIVDGVDDRHYEPGRAITRAEFVTLIMRALKWQGTASPAAAANPFSDVGSSEYYSRSVAEAAWLGIVSGYNGAFRPNDKITREEAVIVLVQAAPYFNLTAAAKAAPDFADMNEVASWAEAAVKEAWSKGLIEGDGVRFHPKQSVTRAEVAVMIYRLLPKGSL
ncbi:S-layer homology domain-containing protein [Paenibacillus doosanensis]|uniref:Endo-1,4-beta-xylanase A n=1 Tax=Paenibacillus konkukensis TaxID=2020716 RepID=A0ABY4RLR0_9BACL|nr:MULTISPECIES: S-layer homology domain-containing protein [Paenibacillus]MCS7463155.1 S-layer homology domain-containing protein [Paenibacillus doosanensis]UQZ82997.1 Endo-1,4-beta-xylanase A precursor [Paenibacillus konkukensis]